VFIRPATLEDAHAIAKVHVSSWQHTYRGLVPDSYLDSMTIPTREKVWQETLASDSPHVIVAEWEDELAGFCSFGSCRDQDAKPKDGEIWSLYIAPDHRFKGLGKALSQAALNQLISEDMQRISLWVIVGNTPAEQFYRNLGFLPESHTLQTFQLAGEDIPEVRYVNELSCNAH
jgi:ribosomal protein S18 acetylase RimI-like enzyme